MAKVINFISGKDFGGPKQSFILYGQLLRSLGHETTLFVRSRSALVQELQERQIPFEQISYVRSTLPILKYYAIQTIQKHFAPYRPDIVFVHKQIDLALVRQSLRDVVIIGVIHGFHAKHIENADALIAVSDAVKRYLQQNGFSKPIYTIPNMIENTKFTPPAPFRTPVRIGSMGVFRRKKGFDILLKALAILDQRGVEFDATIAGRGLRRFYLYFLIWRFDIGMKVRLLPWIVSAQKEEFYRSIDIYVLPSRSESFGMVVAEAMGYAKVVVATACGGPQEIIEDKKTGYLVPTNDPEALAQMLQNIIQNPQAHNQIKANASKSAIERFGIDTLRHKIDHVIAASLSKAVKDENDQ